ncbi:hypothetical protein EC973_007846 [Apophysomyces ossiformis]|uniref:CAP-Gly domain-containing protein n=1 Tax=Apophysomyces ossiformis TaxID=679940 RepID=A0A8H7BU81_9FUNG|nr:hypothetical protein EC973_007846 [Apophysomyces ossiformis]
MSGIEQTRRLSVYSTSRNGNPGATNNAGEISSELRVGARVLVQGKIGTIRYVGTTSFQTGKWIGVELDEPQGKNSGVVQGKRYFDCRTNHGMFVRPSQIKSLPATQTSSGEEDGQAGAENHGDSLRFAPPQDPNLAAARSAQQKTPSASTTLLPSRISSPSRISRLPQQPQKEPTQVNTGLRRPSSMVGSPTSGRSKAIPTASTTSTTTSRKMSTSGKQLPARPRAGTQDSVAASSQREAKERQLAKLRLQQTQRLQMLQQQQQQQQELDENDEEMLEEEEEAEMTGEDIDEAEVEDDQVDEEEEEREIEEEEEDMAQSEEEQESEQEETLPTPENEAAEPQPQPNNSRDWRASQAANRAQQPYGSLATNMPISKSEQMIPLKEYEELRLKLKILETKRQEDRERYREHEKVKEEAEQFLTLRNKLQDKISELQRDLRETKRELKDTTSEKEMFESKYNDVIESLEMMTLDKEVAEERAENLQQEVNVLKDKIEEISVDLDILKKEADIMNRVSDREGDEKTPLEVIQLERHNDRLKEALVRLRDATTEHEADLNRKIKALEKENYELEEIKNQYERVKVKLEIAETQIEDLKQRLDDALGAEDLVEQLTEKNLTLTEKFEEMQMAVDDLEALKELADELEENHIETEKQLQAEIDHRDMLLREQLERLRSSEETNADYEATIQQFRELVMNLQSDLEQLRHKEESQQSEKQSLSSQSQAMMSLNLQLQSTVMKAQAKAIDLELRKLEAAQAQDRLSYIQPYLPDAFFKTENDPISCLLLFKRLVFKSELIIKHLDQNHPISEKIMDTVDENLVSVCEVSYVHQMRQRAGWLSDVAKRFVTFIKNCKPDIFTKMGQVYHDLVGTERRLNGIVELLRTDEVNESECLVELQRMIAQLEHLTEVYLVQNGENNHADQFFGLTRALDLNADRMIVELTFVRQTVENAAKNEDINITEGLERLDYDYLEPLSRLVVQAKSSKIMAKKLLRRLDDLSEQALTLKAEHLHRYKTLYAISSKLSRFCFETYKQITAYVGAKRGSKEEISLGIIQQIVYSKANDILEIAESSMWEGCLKTLNSLINELKNTTTRVENDNKMDKSNQRLAALVSSDVPPWLQRASDMQAEVVVSHDMERKLQQHGEEIVKLIKDIKLKDQALQEASVKVELLEKRMETVKKQADQISNLEEDLRKAQSQQQVYSEALENLQTEYNALQNQHNQLKKTATKKEEKRLSAPKKSDFELPETTEEKGEPSDYRELVCQLETLKAATRYLRAENVHLKSYDIARSLNIEELAEVGTLKIAAEKEDVKNSEDEATSDEDKPDKQALIRSVALETRVLLKDVRIASASPKVVSLSTDRRGGQWQRMKNMPDYQYQAQQSVLHTLKNRSEQLRAKMERLQKEYEQEKGEPLATNNGAKASMCSISAVYSCLFVFMQVLQQGSAMLSQLARIQIPRLISSAGMLTSHTPRRCIQLQSAAEFERIHNVFIR